MHLDLTKQELEVVMRALGNMPFVQVAQLIQKIGEQVQTQLKEAQ